MDGAQASSRYSTVGAVTAFTGLEAPTSRRVVAVSVEGTGVSRPGAAASADLGGSSKYSNENFEDRSGEGFHVNSNWTWVNRS